MGLINSIPVMRSSFIHMSLLVIFLLQTGLSQVNDSITVPGHRHLKANFSQLLFNVTLNRANRYLIPTGKDWSDVSWGSWKENLGMWPSVDWDLYTTNWFAHPYQGAIYYNAARSLKMDYLYSMAYAGLGTTVWEYLGEDLPPSANDFATNILGGIYLGEIMYRLSENILDDRTYGGKRRKKEILAALINPMGGFNRLAFGELGQHTLFKNHLDFPLISSLSISNSYMLSTSRHSNQRIIPLVEYELIYGQLKPGNRNYSPFELFWLRSWLRFDKYDQEKDGFQIAKPFLNISSSALIHGFSPANTRSSTKLIGLFQDYEFLKSYTYELAVIAFSGGTIQEFKTDKSTISSRIQFGLIALGAVESLAIDWVRPEDHEEDRDYVMGYGFNFKWNNSVGFTSGITLRSSYDYWLLPVTSGPDGTESLHRLILDFSISLNHTISIGSRYTYYSRSGSYNHSGLKTHLDDHNSELALNIIFKL